MRKEEKGLQTKRQLAQALKELLNQKQLLKIRVHELTDRCGLYRQTLYYHFEDINALLRWSAQQDGMELLEALKNKSSWQTRLEHLMAYTAEYRGYYLAILDSSFYPDLRMQMQDELEKQLPRSPESDGVQTLSYISIFVSMLEQWIRGTLWQPPEQVVRFFTEIQGETYVSNQEHETNRIQQRSSGFAASAIPDKAFCERTG